MIVIFNLSPRPYRQLPLALGGFVYLQISQNSIFITLHTFQESIGTSQNYNQEILPNFYYIIDMLLLDDHTSLCIPGYFPRGLTDPLGESKLYVDSLNNRDKPLMIQVGTIEYGP